MRKTNNIQGNKMKGRWGDNTMGDKMKGEKKKKQRDDGGQNDRELSRCAGPCSQRFNPRAFCSWGRRDVEKRDDGRQNAQRQDELRPDEGRQTR